VTFDEHYTPLPNGERREKTHTESVRVTEPVRVQFSGIGQKEMVTNAIESLGQQEQKLRAELNAKLAEIKERKNQLLALTHQPAESHDH
jgi:hypothetical protein